MTTTTLYRFFDVDDRLLYVGIAKSPMDRFSQHAADKPWWVDVAKSTMVHFHTRNGALSAEEHAIRTESPVYNVAMNRPNRKRGDLGQPPPAVDQHDISALRAEVSRLRIMVVQLQDNHRSHAHAAADLAHEYQRAFRYLERVYKNADGSVHPVSKWAFTLGNLLQVRGMLLHGWTFDACPLRQLLQFAEDEVSGERGDNLERLWFDIFGMGREQVAKAARDDYVGTYEKVRLEYCGMA